MSDEIIQLENEASALREEGKLEEAIAKLQQLLEIDETFVRAHLALAVLYHSVKDYDKSVAHAEKAVELEPNDAFNYSALSISYQRAFEHTRDPSFIEKAELAMAKGRSL